jgi:hypothetical protein
MKHTRDEAKFLKLRQVIITNTYYIKCGWDSARMSFVVAFPSILLLLCSIELDIHSSFYIDAAKSRRYSSIGRWGKGSCKKHRPSCQSCAKECIFGGKQLPTEAFKSAMQCFGHTYLIYLAGGCKKREKRRNILIHWKISWYWIWFEKICSQLQEMTVAFTNISMESHLWSVNGHDHLPCKIFS